MIGGTAPGAGNVISANGTGVLLSAAATSSRGTASAPTSNGTLDRGNVTDGVRISNAAGNTIGGTVAGARNLISGNNSDGIEITGPVRRQRGRGQLHRHRRRGTGDVGNTQDGIRIPSGATGNTIGGTAPGAGNVISANGTSSITSDGIDIGAGSDRKRHRRQLIGTDATGTRGSATPHSDPRRSGSNTLGGTATPPERDPGNDVTASVSRPRPTSSNYSTKQRQRA